MAAILETRSAHSAKCGRLITTPARGMHRKWSSAAATRSTARTGGLRWWRGKDLGCKGVWVGVGWGGVPVSPQTAFRTESQSPTENTTRGSFPPSHNLKRHCIYFTMKSLWMLNINGLLFQYRTEKAVKRKSMTASLFLLFPAFVWVTWLVLGASVMSLLKRELVWQLRKWGRGSRELQTPVRAAVSVLDWTGPPDAKHRLGNKDTSSPLRRPLLPAGPAMNFMSTLRSLDRSARWYIWAESKDLYPIKCPGGGWLCLWPAQRRRVS